MGMYTEFVFGVSLLSTIPKEVIDILDFLVNSSEFNYTNNLPNHKFFSNHRFRSIALCSSYYFGYSDSNSKFSLDNEGISKEYLLSIRSSIKNYNNEIEYFVDWIKPYVSNGSGTNDLLGYMLYEEASVPYLFYKDNEFEIIVNNSINASKFIPDIY